MTWREGQAGPLLLNALHTADVPAATNSTQTSPTRLQLQPAAADKAHSTSKADNPSPVFVKAQYPHAMCLGARILCWDVHDSCTAWPCLWGVIVLHLNSWLLCCAVLRHAVPCCVSCRVVALSTATGKESKPADVGTITPAKAPVTAVPL